jgi:hypothetical protein
MTKKGKAKASVRLEELHIHRWAVEHRLTVMLASLAQSIAVNSDKAYELCLWQRDRALDHRLPGRPGQELWLAHYDDSDRIYRVVGDSIPTPFGGGSDLLTSRDDLSALSTLAKSKPKQFQRVLKAIGPKKLRRYLTEGVRDALQQYGVHLKSLASDLAGDDSEFADVDMLLHEHSEMFFFLTVFVPCLIEYQTFPKELLRQARAGVVDAIEKILRLDASVIHDPAIWQWVYGGIGGTRRDRERMATSWMRDGIRGKFTLARIKESCAGLISVLSEGLNFCWQENQLKLRGRLSAQAVRGVFDAVWKDRHGKQHYSGGDPMLPSDLGALKKSIQRNRQPWLLLLGLGVDKTPCA